MTVITMRNHIFVSAVLLLVLGFASQPADGLARGFGGFHGGGFSGGGFHGASFGGGGFDRGSYGGASFNRGSYGGASFDRGNVGGAGFNRPTFGGDSFDRGNVGGAGFNRPTFNGDSFDRGVGGSNFNRAGVSGDSFDRGVSAGGFRGGDYGASVSRSQLGGFLGLPTDGGMHAAAGASAHTYQRAGGADVAHVSAGERGVAAGPNGAVAGGRYVGATAVKGPEGNTYVHATAARGAAGYGYGTHAWSPTYCHAQAVAGRGWFGDRGIYGRGWITGHPWAWYPAGYAAADWATAIWATAAWSDAAAWIGAAPQYYAYNYGNDITYQDGDVYYGGQPAGTAEQYYQEAVDLAGSGGTAAATDDSQWLTLGVFGLMPDGKKTPDMVFQLAVNKQGVIRGNYFDQVTQTNLPVTGQVDKKNQRVAWSVGNGKGIVVETGLYNLTQDDSTALVHFGPDKTEQEVLVRMTQPSQAEVGEHRRIKRLFPFYFFAVREYNRCVQFISLRSTSFSGERIMQTSVLHSTRPSAAAERQMRTWAQLQEMAAKAVSKSPAERLPPRTVNFVAISRESGTDGAAVAQLVAETLDWHDYSRNLRDHVAQWYQEPRLKLDVVDETGGNWVFDMFGPWLDHSLITHEKFVAQVAHMIHILARRGPAVFVGRGAQFLLPRAQTFAVRLVAPEAYRIERVQQRRNFATRGEARRFIRSTDAGRRDFISRHFHHDVADPHLYELVINVQGVGPIGAAAEIVFAVCRAQGRLAPEPPPHHAK